MGPVYTDGSRIRDRNFIGDEPSYIDFKFDSLYSILNNQRTIGLPLLISFYNLIFPGFQFYPYFQFALYAFSVLFLFWSMVKFGFDKFFSFIVAVFLLWNMEVYVYLILIYTEIPTLSFLNISLAMMLLAIKHRNRISMLLFSLILFYLYQIRPNAFYVALLAPFWAAVLSGIPLGFNFSKMKRIFRYFLMASYIPLFLYLLLRLAVVGQAGPATVTGLFFASHATHYLNEQNVTRLSGVNRILGETILGNKRKLSFPCNLSPFSREVLPNRSVFETEADCVLSNGVTAMQAAIKFESGKEPFSDPGLNIESWKHTASLAPFISNNYHASTDKLLMNYAVDILKIEWQQYFSWIIFGGLYGLKYLIQDRNRVLIYFLCMVAAYVVQYILSLKLYEKNASVKWQRQLVAFSFIPLTNFAMNYLVIMVTNHPLDRYFITITVFMFPALILWAIPPWWLIKKRSGNYLSL